MYIGAYRHGWLFLWTCSISPFLQAAESIKNATAAEEKLQEVEQRFSKIETELLGKQKNVSEKEGKIVAGCSWRFLRHFGWLRYVESLCENS